MNWKKILGYILLIPFILLVLFVGLVICYEGYQAAGIVGALIAFFALIAIPVTGKALDLIDEN